MIAFVCATSRELSCLSSHLQDAAALDCPRGMRLARGSLEGSDVIALACGVGKIQAAAGTRYLLDKFAIDCLISYGSAGALSPSVKAGDLVVATQLIHGDTGISYSRGFAATGPGIHGEEGLGFVPSCDVPGSLVALAAGAAREAGQACHSGRMITCDQVVLDPELREHLGGRFQALAVEMEGAAVALVAAAEGVPFLALRAISDDVHHDCAGLEKLLLLQGRPRRNIWARSFLLAVTDPGLLARSRGMGRAMDLALENLGAVLPVLARKLNEGFPPA